MKTKFAVEAKGFDVAMFDGHDEAVTYARNNAPATIWHWAELAGVQGRFVEPNPGARPVGKTLPATYTEFPPHGFLATGDRP